MTENNSATRPGFSRRLSKAEINACPVAAWNGPISVIKNKNDLKLALEKLSGQNLLGFDTETRPAFKKGVSYLPSLLQLASDNEVFIFQLKHIGLPNSLRSILSDPAITKAGVSLSFDISELNKLAAFDPDGFMDLGDLAKKKGIKNHGLRGLAAVLLGFRISKGAQTSNWAKDELTSLQIKYAATDAWVGRRLYSSLLELP